MTTATLPKTDRFTPSIEYRAIDEKNMEVDIIASTPTEDLHGTMLDQNTWIFDKFKKNPVILYGHEDRPNPMFGGPSHNAGLPVAKALPETIRVVDGKLKMRVRFTPPEVSEFGAKVFRMVKEGFLNTVSVGFIPQRQEVVERTDNDGNVMREIHLKDLLLLEVSIVTIPANDEAEIQRMADKFNRSADEMKRAVVELNESAEEAEKRAQEEYVAKCVEYFEKKQPVNRESTKVLKKAYELWAKRDSTIEKPDNELEAWHKLHKQLDELDEEVEPVEPTEEPNEPEVPEKTDNSKPDEPAARVHLSYNDIINLSENLTKKMIDEATAALQRGVPVSELPNVIDEVGKGLKNNILT